MKYKVNCPSCKKEVTVSTHGAVKYMNNDEKILHIDFDCPECGEEIDGVPSNQGRYMR